ncbi:MAG: MiaB/RimO family radical SAM methylthiotransferase [Fretibacterium sp.]|nr:MiaB/RimO family radical SAM methylthiotransferase [Fretibacterium sp.]
MSDPGMDRAGLKGLKVWVHVLGCRSNLCEGDFLTGALEARGASVSREPEGAEAAVLVTCAVTAEAERKCRQLVHRARRAVGDRGLVAVCGCWAQAADSRDARKLGVDLLVGSRGKSRLPDALEAMANRLPFDGERPFQDLRTLPPIEGWEEMPLRDTGLHTRAFVKVQDGCAHFCTYCIIPFLRGRPVSRPVENVLAEVRRLVEGGCREVVLTGIHLGTYGRDTDSSLAELIRVLSGVEGLERLRLGSLEPFSLDEALLDALEESPVFCPHLHLPLQSGDDGILSLMRRGYTAEEFARVCGAARAHLGDDLHISSDILVGFPGEDEAAFQNTLSLMHRVCLGRVHVFPFSPRPGTAAAQMPDRPAPEVRDDRAARALALGRELLEKYAESFIDRELDVLAEEPEQEGWYRGHIPHFLEARWDTEENVEPNETVRIRVRSVSGGRLEGVTL